MKLTRLKRVVRGVALTSLVGCGAVNSLKHKKGGGDSASATKAPSPGGDAAQTSGPSLSLKLTASYKVRPVDVLVVRDGSSHGQPMDSRIQSALPVLSARLWNLATTVSTLHVAVLDHYFGPDNQDPTKPQIKTAKPIIDPNRSAQVLWAESTSAVDFSAAMLARVDIAGTRGGNARPASVLKAAYDESRTPNGGDMGSLMRPDAFWSILYIGTELNPDDPLDQTDIASALKDHTAGYQISALAIDKAGCSFAGTNKPQQANDKNLPQRNLEVKLQEMTNGIFGSVCAETYSLFMDDFVQNGTGSQYFPVDLPSAVQASSIKIFMADGSPVKDFSYVAGTRQIQVSTLIPNGQTYTIQANVDATSAPVISTDPGDPAVPTAMPK